jgi:protein tyrosine phosphatase (PTP) superfamily phosphohydrolase (DUF442 family)
MSTRYWIPSPPRTLASLACAIVLLAATQAAAAPPQTDPLVARLASVENVARPYPWLLTGGQPDSTALATLAAAGVRGVMNLRAAGEPSGIDEVALTRAMGLRYLPIPTTPADFTDDRFTAFRHHLIAYGPENPLFVHCASGNRVGAALLPWLVLDKAIPEDRALAMAREMGLRDADITQKALDYIRAHHEATRLK